MGFEAIFNQPVQVYPKRHMSNAKITEETHTHKSFEDSEGTIVNNLHKRIVTGTLKDHGHRFYRQSSEEVKSPMN